MNTEFNVTNMWFKVIIIVFASVVAARNVRNINEYKTVDLQNITQINSGLIVDISKRPVNQTKLIQDKAVSNSEDSNQIIKSNVDLNGTDDAKDLKYSEMNKNNVSESIKDMLIESYGPKVKLHDQRQPDDNKLTTIDSRIYGKTINDNEVTRLPTGSDYVSQDRWVWDKTVTSPTTPPAVTPDIDDRGAFEANKCPTGRVRVGKTCVKPD